MITAFKYLEDDFMPGEKILPRKDHFQDLSPGKKKAETAIRNADSRGLLRSSAIYVFENRKVAEALLKQTAGKHLYEVSVNENDILHRADLKIYDEIEEALRNGNPIEHLTAEFWRGTERPSSRIELAVSKIRVNRKIVDKADH